MAYRACYHCELLFDVDEGSPDADMACPQCGQALEDYQPPDEQALDDELYGDPEAEVQQSTLLGESIQAPVNPAIVATHAFDGLSSSVREQLAARQVSLSNEMGQARPTAQVPTPMPQSPMSTIAGGPGPSTNSGANKGPNATRILDISGNVEQIEALVAEVRAAEQTPEPQPTMAIDTSRPATSSVPPGPEAESRFGSESITASGRHTRIEGLAIANLLPSPPKPAVAPMDTPPVVKRAEPPPPMEPIGSASTIAPPSPKRTLEPRNTPPIAQPRPQTLAPVGPSTAARAKPAQASRGGGGGGKTVAIIAIVVVVLGGGGAAAWFMTRDSGPAVVEPVPEGAPSAGPSGGPAAVDAFAGAMADAQAELPKAKGGETINSDSPFVVGGPEGLSTSFGSVPGLPSLMLPEPQVEKDAGGEWVKPLKTLLEANRGADPGRLIMALDYRADAKTVMRLSYSGHKGGFRRFGLGIDRGADGRAALTYTVQPAGAPLPTGGAMIVSLGSISVKVDATDAAGTTLSDGVAVPHKEGTRPDLDAVVARIETLLTAHPAVKRALIYPNPEMTLEVLATVLERVSAKSGKGLFTEVSLAIR